MSKPNNGGSAFPSEQHETHNGEWNQTFDSGMTLRDYFAAKVMAAQFLPDGLPMPNDLELRAAIAYKAADFMLRQRDK